MNESSLRQLTGLLAPGRSYPVEQWNPETCGEIDIRIAKDGSWYHEGGKIERPEMVRLFSSLLRLEGEDYFLVTPVEKLKITVEDLPFVVSLLEVIEADVDSEKGHPHSRIEVITNTGVLCQLDAEHPLRMSDLDGQSLPMVEIRDGLNARFSRNAYYQLVDLAMESATGEWEIESTGVRFSLGRF